MSPTIAELTTEEQQHRRYHLGQLRDTFHRSRHGDYDDCYAEFQERYFGDLDQQEESLINCELIPKYASAREDETYGMLSVHETLIEAVQEEGSNIGSDTLGTPAGVYDLDTGLQINTVTVTLTEDTFQALCGIVAMSEGKDVLDGGEAVNHDGIFCDWDELRTAFPLEVFKAWAQRYDYESDGVGYDHEFGF